MANSPPGQTVPNKRNKGMNDQLNRIEDQLEHLRTTTRKTQEYVLLLIFGLCVWVLTNIFYSLLIYWLK